MCETPDLDVEGAGERFSAVWVFEYFVTGKVSLNDVVFGWSILVKPLLIGFYRYDHHERRSTVAGIVNEFEYVCYVIERRVDVDKHVDKVVPEDAEVPGEEWHHLSVVR